MSLYCYYCSGEIKDSDDADLLSSGLYKHRLCFVINSKIVYHRRTIEIFWGYDSSISDINLPKFVSMINNYGGKVLSYNSDAIKLIYPPDFPERLIKYCGSLGVDFASNLWGINGGRPEIINILPKEYPKRKFPSRLFNSSSKLFIPKKIRKINNPFQNIIIERR